MGTNSRCADDFQFGSGIAPYVIAEMNTSHFGDLTIAREMIQAAKEAGCSCVKFQSWSPESIFSRKYLRENRVAARMYEKFSISSADLSDLAAYAETVGISFSSTPYSQSEVDVLAKIESVPFIKISSMEINNHAFIRYIALSGKPIVLSTGMSTISEIQEAVKVIYEAGQTDLCILHCTSLYPTGPAEVNLLNIRLLSDRFPEAEIGFSDHTLGSTAAVAAVALGATVLEKHFTLDSDRLGMDNHMASGPEVMKQLVQDCADARVMLGSYERNVSEQEQLQSMQMRRSIVTTRSISSGEVIEERDLMARRPGTGMPPNLIGSLLGKHAARDLEDGVVVAASDFN